MRKVKQRHTFTYSLSHLTLKKLLPGAVLALLTTPLLAAEQKRVNEMTLGRGVDVSPRYSGSDKSRVTTPLVLDYSKINGFFASTTRGIGYGNNIGKLYYSAALSYRAGRKDQDVNGESISNGSDYLRGMGDVRGSVINVLGLGYEVTDWLNLQLQGEAPISQRSNGAALHFDLKSPLYTSSTNSVTLTLTGSWGTRKYLQTYYGVSASQSAASGFAQHDAGSGIYAYSMNIDWTHKLNQHWSIGAATGCTHLASDARNSPTVQRKESPTGSLKLTYTF